MGFARDVKNVWLARKTPVFSSLVLFFLLRGLHIDLLVVLFLFPWVVWCVTLVVLERKGRCYLPRGLGTPRGFLYTTGFWILMNRWDLYACISEERLTIALYSILSFQSFCTSIACTAQRLVMFVYLQKELDWTCSI